MSRWELAPDRWRTDLLGIVLRVVLVFGGAVYVPSVVLAMRHGMVGVIVVDTAAIAILVALMIFPRVPIAIRIACTCGVFYALGAALMIGVGTISMIYLLGFSVLTTLLVGLRWGLVSVALNAVTMLAIGYAGLEAPDMGARGTAASGAEWVLITSNFVFVNGCLVLALGAVISVLERARLRAVEEGHERVRAEARQSELEEQLRQGQKMEAIGNLAGGVAHDFNNLLSVILSYSELAIADLPPSDPLRADLEEVKQAGQRAAALTRQLLAFSRKQILEPVVLDPSEVVAGIEKMLRRLLGSHIELSLLTPATVGKIHADAGQLEQVVMNLVVNARDAMPDGGSLTIETANVVLEERGYVVLMVTDTGVGMDHATQARIFEPFFTTKDKSKGTGLGLSTAYGIVQQSGGRITVQSELGHGTTFKVYLPRTDREAAAPVAAVIASTSFRGTETILLVEDEDQVRDLMRTILRKQGYHVLEAKNAGEALLVCEQFTDDIHLLLTDVVMARMNGRQLAVRLAPLRPAMKVLFVSGYTENAIDHDGVLDGGIEFLPKPILPDALVRKVRTVLDAPALRRRRLTAVERAISSR